MIKLPKILPKPKLPINLSLSAKWLAGEGAGSWFVIEKDKEVNYKITRFSPEGRLECEGLFKTEKVINLHDDFSITYPSHCSIVTIMQETQKIRFRPIHAAKRTLRTLNQPQQ
jgi:hypothetical protein